MSILQLAFWNKQYPAAARLSPIFRQCWRLQNDINAGVAVQTALMSSQTWEGIDRLGKYHQKPRKNGG